MEVREEDAGKTLRCMKCRETFRHETTPGSKIPVSSLEYRDGTEVIRVECQSCEERFGIKPAMSGKVIACPVCKARQRFELKLSTIAEGQTTNAKRNHDSRDETSANMAPKLVVKNEAQPGNRATVVHSTAELLSSNNSPSAKALELLPPKYTVAEDVEREVMEKFGEEGSPAISLGIDTDQTRIHRGGESVEVRSFSLDEKRRRKSVRVAIVYLFSIAILVIWFVWLLNQFGSSE